MYKPLAFLIVLATLAFKAEEPTLKGTWEYCGGKVNGKASPPATTYAQQRRYTKGSFQAFAVEKGQPDLKYESGNYTLSADTCAETQTYCLQSQDLIYVTVRYHYLVRNDTLILNGKLPGGAVVEDYWKRLK
ncbi:hypothetical protein [Mucilaginibacter antarcticus]|uniref:Lipocalin-like protein n=1 Tax=Mucilaginibacter antarcticus TaxID=1855725 RepID=A0ABW5XUX3_9SPHI